MTTDTPAPGPDDPDSTTEPGQTLAAELLTTGTVPATTAGTGGGDPSSRPMSATDTSVPVPLNVASPDCAEEFFAGAAVRCVTLRHAASLAELREVLERCLDDLAQPLTLDLIGHSTRGHRLLRLGATPIDMLDPTSRASSARWPAISC